MGNEFSEINLGQIAHINLSPSQDDLQKMLDVVNQEKQNKINREKDMVAQQKRMVDLLDSIETNTRMAFTIAELLERSVEQQAVVIEILADINAIRNCKDEEAKIGMFPKVVNKINSLGGAISGSKELYWLATMALTMKDIPIVQ